MDLLSPAFGSRLTCCCCFLFLFWYFARSALHILIDSQFSFVLFNYCLQLKVQCSILVHFALLLKLLCVLAQFSFCTYSQI